MELFHLRVFQGQLRDQCRFSIISAELINSALQSEDMDGIWFGLQSFLSSSANIAKMLWGSGGKLANERQRLRESLGVDENSPLRDVSMRNNFEHIDERIDRWWTDSPKHIFVDKNLGNVNAIAGPGLIDRFRMYDPETTDLTFWGETFNVQSIVNEIERILPNVEREAAKPHWEE